MPQPPAYTIANDFSADESNAVSGRSTVETASLDTELINIKAFIDQARTNLALMQADDGTPKDDWVDLPSLADAVITYITTNGHGFYIADTGSANTVVATLSPAAASYTTGLLIMTKIAATNTSTTVTLNVNGLGTKAVHADGTGTLPAIGSLVIGTIYGFQYDGTQFQLVFSGSSSVDAANAAISAAAALVSENNAQSSEDDAATDLALTNADVVLTHADVVSTGNDVTATNADVVLTGNDVTSTGNNVTSTNADVVSTGNDVTSTNADVVSTAADVVTTAANAAKLTGTSTTSLAIAVASKVFTTQSGKFFTAGYWLLVTSDANPTNYMHGQVTSYSGTTLTLNVTNTGGSGTLADWTISVSGTRGSVGATGATGATGPAGGGAFTFSITASPTVNSDASNTDGNGTFSDGSVWVNTTTNDLYMCKDSTATTAIWEKHISSSKITGLIFALA